ncbi:arrestin domain-containing protein 3 [Xenentodon cancila]
MSFTVKKLEIAYNPVNESNVFTCGDIVSGQVTVEVAKDCQIDSLLVKFKGKAEVTWTERHGKTTVVYHSKDKYFSVKQYIIRDKKANDPSVVAPGIHVYPFSFQIPFQDLPSSFKGDDGKIVYLLEARLSRSMRIDKTESTMINFVSKADPSIISKLMIPQHESKDKKMNIFTSGTVAMDVNLEKSGFCQGEGLKVLAFIKNNSSREIKPKYCIYRKHSFFAEGKRKLHTKDLMKEVGAPIPPSSSENVTQVITIPHDTMPSILNCSIIKAEYRLRVYLDVKYASDPEIKFDIVILPAFQSLVAPPPSAAGFGIEPFGNQNPPAWGFGPPQPSAEAFGNQNPPAWGFGPPQPSAEAFGNQNPPAWGFGPPQPSAEAFGNQNPPAWGIGPPQPSSAPQPSELPPPYGAHAMYPPLTDFANKYQ